MGTFIPDVQDPTAESQAEVQFFHHLKEALPDEYHVFHSVPYLLGPDHSGLDSDVVIFIDVDGSANASARHQYVAASRAKHRLFVVGVR